MATAADKSPSGQQHEREQGPAQPLPPPAQQEQEDQLGLPSRPSQGQATGSPEAGGGAAAGDGQKQQQEGQRQLVPSGVVKAAGGTIHNKQVGKPSEEQLRLWGHHSSTATVPDQAIQQIGDEFVSFVFSLEVDGKHIDPEPPLAPLAQHAQHGLGGAGQRQRRGGPAPAAPGSLRLTGVLAAGAAASGAGGRPQAAALAAPSVAALQAAPSVAALQAAPLPTLQQRQQQPPPQLPQQVAANPPPAMQQHPPAGPANENAAANAASNPARPAPAPGSKLALPRLHKQPATAALPGQASAARPARQPTGGYASMLAAVKTVVASTASDSDDDFK